MMSIPERVGDLDAPGPWWKGCVGWPDGLKRATLRMPCGHDATLGEGHRVSPEGVVTPSVVCPHKLPSGQPCSFHEWVTLAGWRP